VRQLLKISDFVIHAEYRRGEMINVTKMNNKSITVNSDLIETVEETPDTVITLTTGKIILVKESRQEIVDLVKLYKKELFSRE